MPQVLLLDDNSAQLQLRELLFRRAEIACCISANAGDALALLRNDLHEGTIGAVITDHLMPGMSGVEFVRQLRSFNPLIPVIVTSGLPDAHEEYKDLRVTFRLKPCDPDDLIALVTAALNPPGGQASIM
jgi:DNA-binding NtrC family response regulator